MKRTPEYLQTAIWLSILYIFMLLIWGYSYGRENSVQLIPYAQYLNDNSLFPQDFYIQSAGKNTPNERSFFMLLIKPFGSAMEWAVFIQHYIFSLLLFTGMFRISYLLLKNRIYSFCSLIILLIPLQYHTLGLNEIYGGELASSLVAVSLSVWAIYYWLKNKVAVTFALLIISTLMHPLVGLQTFLLITGSQFILSVINKNIKPFFLRYGLPVLIYFLTAGVFIYLLNARFNDTAIENETFFRLFFVFRNAHHYLPSEFPVRDILILAPLFFITPFFLYHHSKELFVFSLLIISGCIIYTVGVEVLESIFFAETQWFKTTYYLEFFMVIGGLLFMQKIIPAFKKIHYSKVFFASVIALSIFWVLIVFPGIEVSKNVIAYEFPFYKKITPEIDISQKAKKVTRPDALFIQPCSLDALKYYSQRSGYIDYKAITHSKSFIAEWAERFKEVYNVDPLHSEVISFDAVQLADQNYAKLTQEQVFKLKEERGITHMIAPVEFKLNFRELATNSVYTIYEL